MRHDRGRRPPFGLRKGAVLDDSGDMHWAIVSGEYPPSGGGVADYTARLAEALAAAGDLVHVWAPAPAAASGAVTLHPLRGLFRRTDRAQLARDLNQFAQPPQLLIQYGPHAFGRKGMNLGFARWVAGQRWRKPWVMYHEVAFAAEPRAPLQHHLLARVTQRMARQIHRAAARSFVSTPAWGDWLQRLAPGQPPAAWTPVPSNLPEPDPAAVARVRAACAPAVELLGTFCGLDPYSRSALPPLLQALLHHHPRCAAVLAGVGGEALAHDLLGRNPLLRPRLLAPGRLDPAAVAAHLAAADLLLQPYADGVCTRRGTTMAGLALGRCVLTNLGKNTEPLWRDSCAVALAPLTGWLELADQLLAAPDRRRPIADRGRALYHERFALEHTVRALRQGAA